MNKNMENNHSVEAPIIAINPKKYWAVSIIPGVIFWLVALLLWHQQLIDKTILFFFNPARIASDPIIVLSKYVSSYGMAAITILLVLYLLLSRKFTTFNAPQTIYFYTIFSFAISGIAGDLLKEVFARPRPAVTFADEILAWSQSSSPAIPSGHATKSIGLILPFLFLVSSSKKIHRPMKILMSLIAIGVCFSRIALGAHYLSDVLAGIGTALIGFPLSLLLSNKILQRIDRERLPKMVIVWAVLLVVLTVVFMII